ncbi:hypothetical protein C8E95_3092 [Pseudonocardia autotrophica]|uniref:Uncharacterized protein n=2 Tax=Pseudonocardia TaxID=1847 RepID=A0A1Y2MKW6_PSEAH|nr:hypothetical protein BG845_05751 [Pseudonocardia autotrophica]TDN73979.1 hypothetical protein C8E95_3092 [Pseudonocardia autotrophica]BBG04734.1 hypothetical protein Pdca_59430 [Pseudonocardia autotrophica]
MEVLRVDPRDQRWECDTPTYRVYFYEGTSSDEYEIRGANDVHAVIRWAESDRTQRPYVLYVRVDQDGLGLVRLAGRDPNANPGGSANIAITTYGTGADDAHLPKEQRLRGSPTRSRTSPLPPSPADRPRGS